MTSAVHSWKQIGRAFIWQYPLHKKKHRGWHFTCDDAACDSLTMLMEAMRTEGAPSKRSISLARVTPEVWAVPNFGAPLRESYQTMVLEYDPNFSDLRLNEDEGRLWLHVGDASATTLVKALADLKAGGGDYSLPSKDTDAPPIWIWWMLRSKQ
ncbi:hypothetical protein [Sphingosinicella rhizophila]|uniref:Uncharacterized protein n=1 Tax=Sphingosinicella rhizophila TaxID=3050082 RepID=A0ABU3QA08_9SPHN|nr:hypothetical protein [Sphingosinicella sp. GR2756]MDT9600232.1 hypothetical protein [Sphingosinicella sp. GR2756]